VGNVAVVPIPDDSKALVRTESSAEKHNSTIDGSTAAVPERPRNKLWGATIWKLAFEVHSICLAGESESGDSCHILEKSVSLKRPPLRDSKLPPSIPSPPAPPFPHKSVDGVPEYIPIPCKACDQDRKDRLFIRGAPYSNLMTKILVDFASAQTGGKILAQSEGMRGASDILSADENRYLLSPCANKVWFTIRLGDEVFVEKLGIVSNELFASNFRHIQVLGSRQYPTSEWRVLGEIETNPEETQEWFDLSASGQCSKCYVKYIKIRILTHHALEGYTNCALTRMQVFGNTVLQSLDRIQHMNTSFADNPGALLPGYVKAGSRGVELVQKRLDYLRTGQEKPDVTQEEIHPERVVVPSPREEDEGNNPLLKFIEEVTRLKKQYEYVTNSLYSVNQILKDYTTTGGSSLLSPNSTIGTSDKGSSIFVSLLGHLFVLPAFDPAWLVFFILILSQIMTWILVLRQTYRSQPIPDLVVSVNPERSASPVSNGRRFSIHPIQFKKRHHGLWRPQIKRSIFSHLRSQRKEATLDDPLRLPESIPRSHSQ